MQHTIVIALNIQNLKAFERAKSVEAHSQNEDKVICFWEKVVTAKNYQNALQMETLTAIRIRAYPSRIFPGQIDLLYFV